jgi:acyl-CoA thioester hydrolase
MSNSSNLPAMFKLVVPVLPADIDEQDHVNNTVHLRWVQEVAVAHWRALTSPNVQESIGWVVLRHEIEYKMPAVISDEIELITWVGKATRLTFERFTEIRRKRDDQLLARARTMWCPIDPKTGRPLRVPDEVRSRFST